jgi:hypothetical protein
MMAADASLGVNEEATGRIGQQIGQKALLFGVFY